MVLQKATEKTENERSLAVDGAGAVAERAGVALGEEGADFGDDAEGDFFGRFGAEIETNGGVEAREGVGVKRGAGLPEVGENALGAFLGAEETDVAKIWRREEIAKNGNVVHVMVSHHDGQGMGNVGGAGGEFVGGSDDEAVGEGEAFGGGEVAARIGDRDVPAEFFGEAGEGARVVAGAKDEEGRGGGDGVEENEGGGCVQPLAFAPGCGRCEVGAEVKWIFGYVDDGEIGGAVRGKVGGDSGGPGGARREFFDQDLDDAVAAEADAPDKVIFGGGVVGDEVGRAGFEDAGGAGEDVLLKATAADGADAPAVVGEEKPGAGTAIGRAGNGDERGEDRRVVGRVEVAENRGELVHEDGRGA